ncbi:alpha/beta hydrolase [Hyalangium gracile]|uniref:alpha/beta hydrolase n=1 Tax=Hyalangium gracile TaxID=394092 RepID=UPI001CCBB5A5|nr:alpha/beta hydrolase [Hyalangium gracile]
MKEILFIHSAGPQGDLEGSGRLVAGLKRALPSGYTLQAPLMPAPDAPRARPWLEALARHVARARPPFALVGHSLGGSLILKYLAENPVPGGLVGVVSVAAPFWNAPDWEVAEFALPPNAGERLASVPRIVLLNGRGDDVVPLDHLSRYARAVPTVTTREIDGDHEFTHGDIAAVVDAIETLPGFGRGAS